ncbi:G2/M phase-specific E3 ubiquitin-protein ligase-like [Epinephelus moara]|uniref:G2/M phase-specific E3 ubiquitin-protein ligase-like n=1 Tax=Epinephelus moara TaxID=300413 RepID=UPI00214EEA71|nr:G2/M phase-specific E3 ubiquitin-protein ligase-like [Epinephelus moara]
MAEENVVSDQVTPTSSAISQNSFPPLSTAPVQDGTILVAESTQAQNVVSDQALQEWRAIHAQQDQEYNETLLEDQEKEMKKRAYQAFEERRQKAIQARRQRMAACEEPSDGVSLKFKYPNGYVNMRKFCLSETIQVLFDFVGQHEMASEIFKVQEATSSRSIESNSFGSIMDHDLKASSTLYVLWLSNQDVQDVVIIVDEQEEPVSQNLSPVSQHQLGGPVDETDLQNILTKLVSKIDESFCPTSNQINVCRNNVLLCSLRAFKRRNFNPEAKLDVVFVDEDGNGEGAVDEGGPTREYLRLLMRAIHQSNIFEGHEKDRQLSLDTQALQTNLYTWVAKMIAVCVVHGGVGPHFFSERLFQQICGIPTSPTIVDEVCDHTFRQQLIKIQEATTVQEANSAIAEAADSLSIIGALRHVSNLKEKDSLVQSAADFFVNGRMQTALDQFVEGFRTLGLLEELRENPAVFHSMFVSEERPLQAKDLFSLFGVDYSVQGSNNRAKENSTICYWRDWLIDVEEGECSPITLEKVLEFSSGASTVPPLGFPHRPQIHFIHEANRVFPEANTCLLILRLPIHSDYEDFRKYMKEGILQAPTFGVV